MKISDLVKLLVERLARDGDQDIKSLRLEDTVGKNNVPKVDMIFEYKESDTPYVAYMHALEHGKLSAEVEAIVASDAEYAYLYAINVLKGRFPEGEAAIAKVAYYAQLYASEVIHGCFPEGEPAIASDPTAAYIYANDIIKGRWLKGEPAIFEDSEIASRYANRHLDHVKKYFLEDFEWRRG